MRYFDMVREAAAHRREYLNHDGGEGSGNWGHKGRPGQVGGSGDSGTGGADMYEQRAAAYEKELNSKLPAKPKRVVFQKHLDYKQEYVKKRLDDMPIGTSLKYLLDTGYKGVLTKTSKESWRNKDNMGDDTSGVARKISWAGADIRTPSVKNPVRVIVGTQMTFGSPSVACVSEKEYAKRIPK